MGHGALYSENTLFRIKLPNNLILLPEYQPKKKKKKKS